MIYFQRLGILLFSILTFAYCLNLDLNTLTGSSNTILTKADENTDAICRYRDWADLYPPHLFIIVSGAYCYNYSQNATLNYRLPLYGANLEGLLVPYTVVNNTVVLFDYTNQTYVDLITPSFSEERFFDLWLDCCELADECCRSEMNETNVIPDDEYVCPALWDGWDCWPATRAGETRRRTCPAHIYSSASIECLLRSEKYCLDDGWNQLTNYETCATAPVLRRRHNFHVIVLAVSTALTLPGILIFFIFMRNQKTLRSVLHRNLLVAIVLKNVFTIMSKEIIILDSLRTGDDTNNVMRLNGVGCRILSFMDSVSTTAVFTCMFAIGFYLHQTIARVFSKDLSVLWLYILVIACSVIPSLAWAIAMGVTEQDNCWVVDLEGYQWITDVYKYAVLIANLILLLDIVRVIWTRRFNLNKEQTRAAFKATLALILLFGLPLLLTSQRGLVDETSCVSGDIYYFIAYSVEALQGVLVALLFCYLNKDVHMEIKKFYTQTANSLNSRYGWNLRVPMQPRVTVVSNVRPSVDASFYEQKKTESFS